MSYTRFNLAYGNYRLREALPGETDKQGQGFQALRMDYTNLRFTLEDGVTGQSVEDIRDKINNALDRFHEMLQAVGVKQPLPRPGGKS